MRAGFFLFFLFMVSCSFQIDSGQEVLYKKGYSEKLLEYQSFPMSSWSYLVTDRNYKISTKDLDVVEKSFPVVMDSDDPRGMDKVLKDWVLDGVFLDSPPINIDKSFASAISKAQFFEMFNPGGLKHIQRDPFGRSEKFMSIWSKNFQLSNKEISLKYRFTPVLSTNLIGENSKINWLELESLFKKVNGKVRIVGVEYFTRVNKKIILKDLKKVGIFGGIFLILLMLGMIYSSFHKILLFMPFIGVSMYFSVLFFCGFMGSIHGLVLSFGISIVGLSMDYAIHAAFSKDKKRVWCKNLIALLTTVFAFFCLSFSSLPLFRGIAIFAVLGLILSFVSMWIFDSKFNIYQKNFLKFLEFQTSKKWMFAVFIVLPFLGVASSYNKSLKPFLYIPPAVQDIMLDLSRDQEDVFVRVSDFSDSGKIEGFGLKSFTEAVDKASITDNAEAWLLTLRNFDRSKYNNFFNLYIDNMIERGEKGYDPRRSLYSSLFLFRDREIEFLKVKDSKDIKRAESKGFWSPKDLVDEMGGASLLELIKLFGIAITTVFLVLLFVSKSIFKVLAVFFPFALFVVVFLSTSLFFTFQVNVVHIIGLLIVFGISLDYGVFGVGATAGERKETFTAFCLSGLSTFFGFAPLAFATHPVLSSLGVSLVVGVLCSFVAGVILLGTGTEKIQV